MKIELKHITPYLPYRLKCHGMGLWVEGTEDNEYPTPKEHEIIGASIREGLCYVFAISDEKQVLEQILLDTECFPILRPLSDLTKEIDGIIPIKEMAFIADSHFKFPVQVHKYKVFQEDGCNVIQVHWTDSSNPYFEVSWAIEDYDADERNDRITMTLGGTGAIHNSYNVFQILFKYHFDVFGLINKGLAININTLNQK